MSFISLIFIVFIQLQMLIPFAAQRLSESERVKQWYERGNTWPPQWHNETDEYKGVMKAREEEIMSIPGFQSSIYFYCTKLIFILLR